MKTLLNFCFFFLALPASCFSQQIPGNYDPEISVPEYVLDEGPRVFIDEAHSNFHTVDGRYAAFAGLIRKDGYRVNGIDKPFSAQTLRDVDILVITNALNERNETDWSLPTPSAFSPKEIAAVRDWVNSGGSLFLIADHMPFPGAASKLAAAFDVTFSNGYAIPGNRKRNITDTFDYANGLIPGSITCGRNSNEQVTKIATFGGSAFVPPSHSIPIILFGKGSISAETTKAPGVSDDAEKISIEGWSQGAVFSHGCGRVAVFGEAAMFTAQLAGQAKRPMGMNAPEAEQNHQLLLNIMHWLSHRIR